MNDRSMSRWAALPFALVFLTRQRAAAAEPSRPPLTLHAAIAGALAQAPDAAVARADADEAQASARLAEAGFRPEAFARTTPGYSTGLPVLVAGQVPSVFGVSLHSALYDPARRAAALGARAAAAGRLAAADRVAEQTARAAVLAYGRNWASSTLLEVARRSVEAREAISRRTAGLRGEGRATDLDVQGAELEVARAKQRLLDRMVQTDLDQFELKRLLDWPAGEPLVLAEDPLTAFPEPRRSETLAAARARDPEAKAIDREIEALARAAQIQGRLFQPVVQAEAQYLRLASYNNFDQYFVKFRPDDFAVAVSITVPLWTGGRSAEASAGARARLARAEASRRSRAREIELEVLRAEGELARAGARHAVATSASGFAAERLRVARALAGEGRAEANELDLAEAGLGVAREDEASAAQGVLAARVAVAALRGDLPLGN
ncbi:MAG: TolC family protein [Acidobacteriota bacterium]